ncbi:hypothetical protein [Psychromicrobium xiongbiense]|uniref:hypothetical protein n=1 Tax=Psychromicrobium xiongbiense TaxID=3051184 RepID=UPI002554AB08|nr:hypothetical protein [Psychromicrobium sp. YIM S02556]
MSFLDSLSQSDPLGHPHRAIVPENRCSRKGCRELAHWQVRWNNPKVHTPERLKVWLACEEHRAWLEDYLHLRDFWRDTVPLDASTPAHSEEDQG